MGPDGKGPAHADVTTLTIDAHGRADPRARDTRPLVLVVDDEESYREALASGLAQEGFATELAANGYEALRMFHQIHPDLVLLDVMLPDQSGIELCKRMRASNPVPIIMVTARDSEVDVVLGLELGASDYVAKPFRLRELVARMRAVLRRGSPTPESSAEILQVGPVRLDTHVKRLRRKIEPDPANPRHLVTIRGVGFRFDA